ncbi:MAG: hydantoinase B/oxoprolinase family protein, partial [Hyphomicrobiales bacterium]
MNDMVKAESKTNTKTMANPVVTEIVRNGLVAVTEEMKINLMRTAYNMIIYEALDFTVGMFDARGNTVSIGLGLPMFIRGMSETVKAKIAHFKGDIDPGDILLTNDAYITGSHLNHMTFSVPVFHDNELVGFSCCMAHWPDVGGMTPGGASSEGCTEIYQEGLRIPPMRIMREGKLQEDLFSFILLNMRFAEDRPADLRAQVAANQIGEQRLHELAKKYG